jgi:hypothetical protein
MKSARFCPSTRLARGSSPCMSCCICRELGRGQARQAMKMEVANTAVLKCNTHIRLPRFDQLFQGSCSLYCKDPRTLGSYLPAFSDTRRNTSSIHPNEDVVCGSNYADSDVCYHTNANEYECGGRIRKPCHHCRHSHL